ncbi:cell adhesion molecule Dscam1 isoform X13 [Planococcus citri]|uniref:cell adhesion molecule Dscam1 isoform X13 n=1 Tax=Planococcus citri TaxID=170843 RepID=UPI0031F97DDA
MRLKSAILSALLFVLSSALFGHAENDTVGPTFIKEPPNKIDFSNTTGATLECTARGNPAPEIIWLRGDGTAVGEVPGLRQVLPNGNLVFPPFRAEDYRQEVHAQVYICMARNSVGSIHSRDVNVRAVVEQHYQTEVNNEYVILGNSAILKCSIPSFLSDFVMVIAWQDDTGNIYNSIATDTSSKGKLKHDGKYLVLPSGELHIRDVAPEDGFKSYQCRTKHKLTGETRLSATKGRLVITEPTNKIPPKVPGKKYEGGEIVSVEMKAPAYLLCQVTGFPAPMFRWYKFVDGTSRKLAVVLDDRVKQVSGTLIIQEAKVEDSGKYLCVVNNSVGGESVETVLTVTAPLSASVEPIVQTVDFGRPAVLTCNYEGNPVKTVSWLKDGKPISSGEGRSLKIDSVRKDDKGMYQCFVRNEQESAQGSAEIKLGGRFDPPQITQAFTEEVLKEGPPVYLKCVASGNPTPEITWFLDSKKIETNEKFQISNQVTATGDKISYLNITNVQTNDGGLYKCEANSKVGSASHSARLNVHGLPYVRRMEKQMIVAGGTLFVTCPFAGYPIETVTWERDSRTLPINRKQRVFPNGTLIIENVERSSDQATYTCLAKSPNGYSSKDSLEVQVLVRPRIAPFKFEEPMFAGQAAQVACLITEGDLPLNISWSFSGSGNTPLSELGITTKMFGVKSNVLLIESTEAIHSGNYTCTVNSISNFAMTQYTAELNINVPPRWILEPSQKAFAQGSDAKIECKADGFPRPTVTWKKATGQSPGDYKDLKNNSDIKVEDGTLTINNIQKSNEGYYLCEAVNGIGSGLSAVITVNVQAPPQFDIKLRNQTARKDEPAVLQCEAKGEKPIGILWNMNNKRLDSKGDGRFTIREDIQQDGVLSGLSIKRTERSDSALFTCIATNSFGSDDSSINLIVQEPPEAPYGLKVLNKSGRSVQMSWIAPYTGNSPITKYHVEYKITRGTWDTDMERVFVAGHETLVSVMTLRPATTYHFRIVAENELGLSEPSDVVTIISAEEAPSGAPTEVRVEPVDQKTLKVFWKPPERSEWNGEIQGYYVGYKPIPTDNKATTDKPYVFETVEFNKEDGKEHHLEIHNLKTYTQYSVVVQAFNKLGPGPLSNETRQFTAEGIPEQPPHDISCTTLTSQTIRVSWISPPLNSANGIIKGYKVIFGPSESWFDESTKDTMITSSSETILHGLKKYTNYSMEILAYTSGGDGVRTNIIHCQTDQDVPEPPSAIKALVMSVESILVSWKSPVQPNGVITQYTVYYKEHANKEAEPKSEKVSPLQMNYEAKNLKKAEQYEFWVTASTNVGEGQASKTITVAPNAKVSAKIASFSDNFTATYREDVKLPCLTVGQPAPEISWKIKGRPLESNERIRQLAEGSLLIKTVTRTDAGEYSCSVENSFGKDHINHRLIIHAPPHQPEVKIESTTNNSIVVLVKPHPGETEPIHGYTIRYKPDFGEAETVQIPPNTEKFLIENLSCGMRYNVQAFAYNSIGNGDTSVVQQARTSGSKPAYPNVNEFITVATNSVTLQLTAWKDGGCPMYYFVIEYKKKAAKEWNQIANNVKPTGNYLLLDLEPATWYHLRVTAHNSAGFVVGEYEFATLTMEGSTLAPPEKEQSLYALFPWLPTWLDLNIVVPAAATVVVVFVGIIVICVAWSRRHPHGQTRLRDDVVYNQSMMNGNTIDKRRPDLRDELGYIAPPNRKLPPVPGSNYNTCDRVKRGYGSSFRSHSTWDPRGGRHTYEELNGHGPCRGHLPPYRSSDETLYQKCRGVDDEICPYATFHLLGFREEMDPSKAAAMQFQTFPHQNGHSGTIGPTSMTQANGHIHQRTGSQSMPRTNGRYSRVGSIGGPNSTFSPEYDDPANCGDEEPYGSQYGSYGAPYDHFGSRNSVGRRSFGSARNLPGNSSPEPPPPPPRNHDPNSSGTTANDSKESNEMSEAECDMALNRASYGVGIRGNSKDGLTTEEMRKLIDRNEAGYQQLQNGGFTTYDTVAV